MSSTTHQSHAKDPQAGSYVPEKAQEKLPKGVEDSVPDASEFLFSGPPFKCWGVGVDDVMYSPRYG